jgi:glycosyltransferase involved in cell wall biosynthesis
VKLLLINHEYPPIGGGAATASEAIAHSLTEFGHDVSVITSRYRNLRRYQMENGVAVHRVSCLRRRADRSNLFEMLTFTAVAFVRLPFILKKSRPDALIVFFSLPSGPLALVARLFFGIPYVISLRGGDVPGLVPELDVVHKIAAPIRRLVLKNARVIVANSEGLQKLSEKVDRYPVRVIPNGVDTDFFQPDSTRSTSVRPNDPLRTLFVGRFQEQKNLEFFLRALGQLPADSFYLHMVGDGPQEKRLRNLADQLGISNSITWHGWVARAALPKTYQAADCLVNPSSYEGLPNVVLEAMACGLPVVASAIPGNVTLVQDGETGLLFDLNKSETMLVALKTLMTNYAFRHKLGCAGRARAVSQFSWRATTERYIELFSRPMH